MCGSRRREEARNHGKLAKKMGEIIAKPSLVSLSYNLNCNFGKTRENSHQLHICTTFTVFALSHLNHLQQLYTRTSGYPRTKAPSAKRAQNTKTAIFLPSPRSPPPQKPPNLLFPLLKFPQSLYLPRPKPRARSRARSRCYHIFPIPRCLNSNHILPWTTAE